MDDAISQAENLTRLGIELQESGRSDDALEAYTRALEAFPEFTLALLRRLGLTRTSVAGLAFASPRASAVRSIAVAVQLNDNTRFLRRATIERVDQPLRPFTVLAWDIDAWPASLPPATAIPCSPQGP